MSEGEVTVLDRLVDGELSPGERQQVLRWLDMREDGWRRCALAFLEAQTWGHQFKQLIADPADGKVVAAAVGRGSLTWLAFIWQIGLWLAGRSGRAAIGVYLRPVDAPAR